MQANWIRSALVAAACLCGAAVPMAQQPSPSSSQQIDPVTAILAGRVVDAMTSQAIAGVTVSLAGAPGARGGGVPAAGARTVLTDSKGRFVFAGLAAGRYMLLPQKIGYATATVLGRPIELTREQKLTDVAIRMHRLASMAGTVTDENGDAVPGMGVIAYRRTVALGQIVPTAASESRTDDRGAYRLANLQPGDYVVCACRRDQIPVDGVLLTTLAADPAQLLGLASRALKVGADAVSIEGVRTFAPAFHPASTLLSRATRIALAEAEDRTNIDISVPVVRASRISGTIVGAPGGVTASAIRLRVAGEMPESSPNIEPMLVQPDGRFYFTGIPPGSYVINVVLSSVPSVGGGPSGAAMALTGGRAFGPPPPPPPPGSATPPLLWGQTTVVVGDADVNGVVVPLRKLAQVTVKVELPPDVTPSPRQPPVQFVQLNPLQFESRALPLPFARPDQSGAFVLPNVGPGRYGLNVSTNLQVSKVVLGGIDVTDQAIEVGEADVTDLVVSVVNAKPSVISGTIPGDAADTSVLIFPADRKMWVEPTAAFRLFSAAPVDRSGKFTSTRPLPAGEYLVIAVPDEQATEWQVQSKLEALALRAQKVTLAAGETKVIEVKR